MCGNSDKADKVKMFECEVAADAVANMSKNISVDKCLGEVGKSDEKERDTKCFDIALFYFAVDSESERGDEECDAEEEEVKENVPLKEPGWC